MTVPCDGPPNASPSFMPACVSDWIGLLDPESLNIFLNGIDATRPDLADLLERSLETLRPRADHQVPPDEAWSTWLFLGGRGAGKTFAGAAWMIEQARALGRLALIGPTFHDVREVMIEGPSGLRALSPRDARPRWEASRRRLVGNFPHAFSHIALVNTAHNLTPREKPSEHRGSKKALPSKGDEAAGSN